VRYSKIIVKGGVWSAVANFDQAMPTYERFLLAAKLLGISPDDLARRLGDSAADATPPSNTPPTVEQPETVRVHATYLGRRIEGVFE
jgi:hypothetical protein